MPRNEQHAVGCLLLLLLLLWWQRLLTAAHPATLSDVLLAQCIAGT
jgi:hypothetical protein